MSVDMVKSSFIWIWLWPSSLSWTREDDKVSRHKRTASLSVDERCSFDFLNAIESRHRRADTVRSRQTGALLSRDTEDVISAFCPPCEIGDCSSSTRPVSTFPSSLWSVIEFVWFNKSGFGQGKISSCSTSSLILFGVWWTNCTTQKLAISLSYQSFASISYWKAAKAFKN